MKYITLPLGSQGILSTDVGTRPSYKCKFNLPLEPFTLLCHVPGIYGGAIISSKSCSLTSPNESLVQCTFGVISLHGVLVLLLLGC